MDDMIELSLSDVLRAIKKMLIPILIVPVLVAVAAWYYVDNNTVDIYTARVKLYTLFEYVDSTGTLRYDMGSSTTFTQDYREFIQTPEVLNETCRRLGWTSWPMSVAISEGTSPRIINISVSGTDPEDTLKATNTLATVFMEFIRELYQTDSISIVSQAQLPKAPSNGGRENTVALAYFAAVVALIGLAVLMVMLDTRVRSESDIDVKMHVNVLSRIEGYKKEMDTYLKQRRTKGGNLMEYVNEYTRENIKKLALNLQFATMGEPLRTMTVTSTESSEGKSSISLMLGIELANEGKRVLLVDMDYRSPILGRYIGKRVKKDLMDYLSGREKLESVVTKTNVENLFFIDNNHHMAVNTRMDATDAFDAFIADAKQYFDLIIFDTPPLGLFVDAASLAAKSDGALVIVGDGMIERKNLEKVLKQLEQVNARLLGIAFNFVRRTKRDGYYRKYYYRYGDQHKEERRLAKYDEPDKKTGKQA